MGELKRLLIIFAIMVLVAWLLALTGIDFVAQATGG